MKKIAILFLLIFSTHVAVAQEQNTNIAALRSDIARLTEAYKTVVNRINELQELIVALRSKINEQSAENTEIQNLENRLRELEILVNEQNQLLRNSIAQESKIRQDAINALAKEINRDLERINANSRANTNTGSSARVPAGYKLVEIEIARGDTLSEIAQSAGTTVAKIKEINNMKNDRIHVGQKLKVPVKE